MVLIEHHFLILSTESFTEIHIQKWPNPHLCLVLNLNHSFNKYLMRLDKSSFLNVTFCLAPPLLKHLL